MGSTHCVKRWYRAPSRCSVGIAASPAQPMDTKRKATQVLTTLALKDANKVRIVTDGGLAPLVAMTASDSVEAQRDATHTICRLATHGAQRPTCSHLRIFVASPWRCEFTALASSDCCKFRRCCSSAQNKMKLVDQGLLPHLVALAKSEHLEIQRLAAVGLTNLSTNGARGLLASPSSVLPATTFYQHYALHC